MSYCVFLKQKINRYIKIFPDFKKDKPKQKKLNENTTFHFAQNSPSNMI